MYLQDAANLVAHVVLRNKNFLRSFIIDKKSACVVVLSGKEASFAQVIHIKKRQFKSQKSLSQSLQEEEVSGSGFLTYNLEVTEKDEVLKKKERETDKDPLRSQEAASDL